MIGMRKTANLICATCTLLFSAFFTICFMIHTGSTDFDWFYYYPGETSFWMEWSNILRFNLHVDIALALDVIALIVVIMLIRRRQSYEKHRATFLDFLVTAMNISFLPMAAFYLLVFKTDEFNPATKILPSALWIAGKFTFFVVIDWIIVLFTNTVYVIRYRRKRNN